MTPSRPFKQSFQSPRLFHVSKLCFKSDNRSLFCHPKFPNSFRLSTICRIGLMPVGNLRKMISDHPSTQYKDALFYVGRHPPGFPLNSTSKPVCVWKRRHQLLHLPNSISYCKVNGWFTLVMGRRRMIYLYFWTQCKPELKRFFFFAFLKILGNALWSIKIGDDSYITIIWEIYKECNRDFNRPVY